MSRIKIMLTAVIILGIMGGVLAYKKRRFDAICTAFTVNNTCPANNPCNGEVIGKITAEGGAIRCTATPHPVLGCVNKICTGFARTDFES